MQRPAWPMIAVVVLLTIPACSSDRHRADQTSTTTSTEPATTTNTFDLQLAEGADSASTTFRAEDPRTHGETIEITITPANPAIVLDFVTADGATLHVLAPPHENSCTTTDGSSTCTILLPRLEARSPGQWQAVASKPTGPPAALDVTVTWERDEP